MNLIFNTFVIREASEEDEDKFPKNKTKNSRISLADSDKRDREKNDYDFPDDEKIPNNKEAENKITIPDDEEDKEEEIPEDNEDKPEEVKEEEIPDDKKEDTEVDTPPEEVKEEEILDDKKEDKPETNSIKIDNGDDNDDTAKIDQVDNNTTEQNNNSNGDKNELQNVDSNTNIEDNNDELGDGLGEEDNGSGDGLDMGDDNDESGEGLGEDGDNNDELGDGQGGDENSDINPLEKIQNSEIIAQIIKLRKNLEIIENTLTNLITLNKTEQDVIDYMLDEVRTAKPIITSYIELQAYNKKYAENKSFLANNKTLIELINKNLRLIAKNRESEKKK